MGKIVQGLIRQDDVKKTRRHTSAWYPGFRRLGE